MQCAHCTADTLNLRFCSNNCQHLAQREERITKLRDGRFVGKHLGFATESWARNLLIETFGYKCNSCGRSTWQDKPITLEVNHKDGVATNNVLTNLEFLCPNCHSQTPTFRALNKHSTRGWRRKPC